MEQPIYIVSDNHFTMNDSDVHEQERRNKLFNVLNKIKKNKRGTLIIGGDFFDYWFEYKNVIPNGYQNIIEELKNLKKSGITIHYILGNHDYWDFGYLNKEIGLITHKNDFEFNYNNKKILITHGDGLLKNDYGYRCMNRIIRSKLNLILFYRAIFSIFFPDIC